MEEVIKNPVKKIDVQRTLLSIPVGQSSSPAKPCF
jgi:hypothetical protein